MTGTLIRTILLVLVLIAWAWILVGALRREGGFGHWFRASETRKDRNTFLFLTFVLAAMVAMQVALPA
ncbi:hypothetical protein [Roseicyclus sp.]|uniref:hypothetical protein n=1 Tax=Roseicyclus sp. TaxID=1914329 RepID=UPI003FA0937B